MAIFGRPPRPLARARSHGHTTSSSVSQCVASSASASSSSSSSATCLSPLAVGARLCNSTLDSSPHTTPSKPIATGFPTDCADHRVRPLLHPEEDQNPCRFLIAAPMCQVISENATGRSFHDVLRLPRMHSSFLCNTECPSTADPETYAAVDACRGDRSALMSAGLTSCSPPSCSCASSSSASSSAARTRALCEEAQSWKRGQPSESPSSQVTEMHPHVTYEPSYAACASSEKSPPCQDIRPLERLYSSESLYATRGRCRFGDDRIEDGSESPACNTNSKFRSAGAPAPIGRSPEQTTRSPRAERGAESPRRPRAQCGIKNTGSCIQVFGQKSLHQRPWDGIGSSKKCVSKSDDAVCLRESREGEDYISMIVAANAGKTVDHTEERLDQITRLELVMDRPVPLLVFGRFTALTELTLVCQGLESLLHIGCCPLLKKLIVSDNKLRSLQGLSGCVHLQTVDASFNRIQRVDRSLEGLLQLQILRMPSNRLSHLHGISSACNLVEIHVAGNKIQEIGSALNHNIKLQRINLASNRIRDLEELLQLKTLPELRELHLADFDFSRSQNPVCRLEHVETFCLYHMPRLQVFNKCRCDERRLQAVAQKYKQNHLYFSMKLQLLKRQFFSASAEMMRRYKANTAVKKQALGRILWRSARGHTVAFPSEECGSGFCQTFANVLHEGLQDSVYLRKMVEDSVAEVRRDEETRVAWEYETAGNVVFEKGDASKSWFENVISLMQTRFRAQDYKSLGCRGVQVRKVTRVHNRMLELRFNEQYDALVEGSVAKTELLFYGLDPEASKEMSWHCGQVCIGELCHRCRSSFQRKFFCTSSYCTCSSTASASSAASYIANFAVDVTEWYACWHDLTHVKRIVDMPTLTRTLGRQDTSNSYFINLEVFESPILDDDHVCGPTALWRLKPSLCTVHPGSQEDEDDGATTAEEDNITWQRHGGHPENQPTAIYRCREGCSEDKQWWILNPDMVLPLYHVTFEYVTDGYGQQVMPKDIHQATAAPLHLAPPPAGCSTSRLSPMLCTPSSTSTMQSMRESAHPHSSSSTVSSFSCEGPGVPAEFAVRRLLDSKCLSIPRAEAVEELSGIQTEQLYGCFKEIISFYGRLISLTEDLKPRLCLESLSLPHSPEKIVRTLLESSVDCAKHTQAASKGTQDSLVECLQQSAAGAHGTPTASGELSGSRLSEAEHLTGGQVLHVGAENHWTQAAEATSRKPPTATQTDLFLLERVCLPGRNIQSASFCLWGRLPNLRAYSTRFQELRLPWNKIAAVEDLFGGVEGGKATQRVSLPNLVLLDISYNTIENVSSFPSVPELITLDLSFNLLDDMQSCAVIGSQAPKLQHLRLKGNPLHVRESTQKAVLEVLPSLLRLEDEDIQKYVKLYKSNTGIQCCRTTLDIVPPRLVIQRRMFADVGLIALWKMLHIREQLVEAGICRYTTITSYSLSRDTRIPLLGALALKFSLEDAENHSYTFNYMSDGGSALASCRHPCCALRQADTGHKCPGISMLEKVYYQSLSRAAWTSKVECIELLQQGLEEIPNLAVLPNLTVVNVHKNRLTTLRSLLGCDRLEVIIASSNRISNLADVCGLKELRYLDVGDNRIEELPFAAVRLQNLLFFAIESNMLSHVQNVEGLTNLTQLYLGFNRLHDFRSIVQLRRCPNLRVLDLTGNVLCTLPDYRNYSLFLLNFLKVLDGVRVNTKLQTQLKGTFSGMLTRELLEQLLEKTPPYPDLSIDLSNRSIRDVGKNLSAENFPNVKELCLDDNDISTLGIVESLLSLEVLQLNRNRMVIKGSSLGGDVSLGIHPFPNLQRLELSFNSISVSKDLELYSWDSLLVLNLAGNNLTEVGGLNQMHSLQELNLSRNKIRRCLPGFFDGLSKLEKLDLEWNGLKSLSHIGPLPALKFLNVSRNRIKELSEVEKLSGLASVRHVLLLNNPVCSHSSYRLQVLRFLPDLEHLDYKAPTPAEIEKAELIAYGAAQVQHHAPPAAATSLALPPGLPASGLSTTADGIRDTQQGSLTVMSLKLQPPPPPSRPLLSLSSSHGNAFLLKNEDHTLPRYSPPA